MSDHPFDSLARTLAAGASRRGVLRALGGAVLGSLVAAPAQTVLAQGNSDCAHFCAATFGADTPAASQCTSEAAHHRGLCYTCGPASSGGTKPICCPTNGSAHCASYSSATCCTTGQTCSNGQCLAPTTTTTAAPTTTTTTTSTTTTTTTAAPCGPGTCNGCCDASGTCQSGTSACGTGGAACVSCSSEQVCQSGQCCLPTGAIFPFNCGQTCCDPAVCCSGLGSNTGFVCTCG